MFKNLQIILTWFSFPLVIVNIYLYVKKLINVKFYEFYEYSFYFCSHVCNLGTSPSGSRDWVHKILRSRAHKSHPELETLLGTNSRAANLSCPWWCSIVTSNVRCVRARCYFECEILTLLPTLSGQVRAGVRMMKRPLSEMRMREN